jgi:hypothetical protein
VNTLNSVAPELDEATVALGLLLAVTAILALVMVVRTVSARFGQTTLLVSERTCRMNSPGETFATASPQ